MGEFSGPGVSAVGDRNLGTPRADREGQGAGHPAGAQDQDLAARQRSDAFFEALHDGGGIGVGSDRFLAIPENRVHRTDVLDKLLTSIHQREQRLFVREGNRQARDPAATRLPKGDRIVGAEARVHRIDAQVGERGIVDVRTQAVGDRAAENPVDRSGRLLGMQPIGVDELAHGGLARRRAHRALVAGKGENRAPDPGELA